MDTCAIAEAVRKRPDDGLSSWMRGVNPLQVYVSAVTRGELRKGIETCANPAIKATLETWLTNDIAIAFAGRILAFDVHVADRWGRLVGALHQRGITPAAIDSLIAATALEHNLSIVTRNVKHFKQMGVGITNPWRGSE